MCSTIPHGVIPRLAFATTALVALIALTTSASASAQMQPCADVLLQRDAQGAVVAGSTAALVSAVQRGERLRVGWQLGPAAYTLVHWAEPSFLSVFGGVVYAQLPAIHVQRAVGGDDTRVELFGDRADHWHGLLGSDGMLSGRHGADGAIESQRVAQQWCRLD